MYIKVEAKQKTYPIPRIIGKMQIRTTAKYLFAKNTFNLLKGVAQQIVYTEFKNLQDLNRVQHKTTFMETSKHALYDCMTEFNFHHIPCNFQTFIDSKLNTKTKTIPLKDI